MRTENVYIFLYLKLILTELFCGNNKWTKSIFKEMIAHKLHNFGDTIFDIRWR